MKNVVEGLAERRTLPDDVWCRACGAAELEPFAESWGVPVNNARVFTRAEDAERVATGALELALCGACGFIGNVRFKPALVTYDTSYEEQQSFSPTFTEFADDLARDLVDRWDLHGKRIIEIGCGKGDFLTKLCALGNNIGIGYDPTTAPGRLTGPGAANVTIIPEFFGSRTGALHGDVVVCRHTLEHIPDVGRFMRTLRRSLDGVPGVRVFFEVPDAMRVLRDAAFWDVYYEHCSYFTAGSLARLFRHEGFAVDEVRLAYAGQYVLLEARVATPGDGGPVHPTEESPADLRIAVTDYAARMRHVVTDWCARVRETRAQGGRVAVWGSGSKCVAFLSETGLTDEIDAVVDVNPHRQGRHLPKSALRIGAPADLVALRPELVIAMNAIYLDEIRGSLVEMDLHPQLEGVG